MNYKTAIVPIVSVLAGAYFLITGHAISQLIQNEITSIATIALGAGVSIWGIIKNHK